MHDAKFTGLFKFDFALLDTPRPVLLVGGPSSGKHSVVRWLAAALMH